MLLIILKMENHILIFRAGLDEMESKGWVQSLSLLGTCKILLSKDLPTLLFWVYTTALNVYAYDSFSAAAKTSAVVVSR